MMKHARWLILGCLALCLLWSSWAGAQAPTTMAYQGRLMNASGTPIYGNTSVVFSIYAAATGGSSVWTETRTVSSDLNGVFTIDLGATTPLTTTVFDGTVRYLGIRIAAEATEMTPRQALSSVPYALRSGAGAPATIEGVANNGGNIDLVPGAGLSITGNDAANTITLAATTGGMHPIAWGIVNTAGTINNPGSGNWTVTWDAGLSRYSITITGVTFDIFQYLALVQPLGASTARFFTTDSSGSTLVVHPWLHDGTTSQFYFDFVVYELPGMKKLGAASNPTDGLATELQR
jgi:hypothetical protein